MAGILSGCRHFKCRCIAGSWDGITRRLLSRAWCSLDIGICNNRKLFVKSDLFDKIMGGQSILTAVLSELSAPRYLHKTAYSRADVLCRNRECPL